MKKINIMIFILTSFLLSQDVAGNYKLSGINATYHDIARQTVPLLVSDIYGQDIQISIGAINQGDIFSSTYNGPHGEMYLTLAGVNLNINLYDDGTGHIAEGSYYPMVEFNGDCYSNLNILPITDNLIYSSNLNAGLSWPTMNVIGLPSHNPYAFDESTFGNVGSFSLTQSVVFDFFPAIPTQTSIPFPINFESSQYPEYSFIPPGYTLPGVVGGFVIKGDANESVLGDDFDGDGIQEPNTPWDITLEWHAIDGLISESGLGNFIGEDEDGDGTDFDAIFGLPFISAVFVNPSPDCGGLNYPIYGDASILPLLSEINIHADCIDTEDGLANDGYVMDASLENWGYFLTYNASQFQNCLAENGGDPTPCLGFMVDDSDHDFNGTDGKLVMRFTPTCIPKFNVRQLTTEFYEIGSEACNHEGDVNSDTIVNVLDIVLVVGEIIGSNDPLSGSAFCQADVNADSIINVLDIVALVNQIIGN
jgi:hypothetical protein